MKKTFSATSIIGVASLASLVIGMTPAFAAANNCAELSAKCSAMCTKNVASFKKKGGKYAEKDRLTLMEDCAAVCKLNADFQNRSSSFSKEINKICSDVCHKCANKCDELKDASLKDCIALCRECADSCTTAEK
jgi:hypothetical protein